MNKFTFRFCNCNVGFFRLKTSTKISETSFVDEQWEWNCNCSNGPILFIFRYQETPNGRKVLWINKS